MDDGSGWISEESSVDQKATSLEPGKHPVSKEEKSESLPSKGPLAGLAVSPKEKEQNISAESGQVMEGIIDALHDVEVKLADKQADAASPLYSAKTFEELGLDEKLLKGIYGMRFKKPSKVQEKALPLLLADPPTNMIAQSQSGTGKTAAFALTMLSRVKVEDAFVQAVCLAPTRELARQIYDVVTKMGQYTDIKVTMALREEIATAGTNSASTSSRAPIASDHILIGTPGTINDLERKRLVDLSKVRIFVLDEADVMLDKQGLGIQSLRVHKACPANVQTVLFSATFTDEVAEFSKKIAPNANEISLKRTELSIDAIKQFYMDCHGYRHKFEVLSALYGLLTIGQSMIFVATRKTADEVQAHMESEGHRTSVLHGGMTPEERDAIIDEFRLGRTKVLISTNVLARGIDILQVSLVVNFDLPYTVDRMPDPETYLHRIGRTGRFGRSGVAINFVSNRDNLECMLSFEKYFGRPITRVPTESIESIEAKLASVQI